MPKVVPYTLTFEIVTIFPPRDFLFLSPMQVIGFLCSFLQREITATWEAEACWSSQFGFQKPRTLWKQKVWDGDQITGKIIRERAGPGKEEWSEC